jgi:mono/diheme cytochrome c family protein
MGRLRLRTGAFVALFVGAVVAACSSSDTPAATGAAGGAGAAGKPFAEPTATTGTVERGQYLVDHVLACGVCHTPNGPDGKPDMTKYLAGSRSYDFTDVDGTIVTVNAENLTTHNPEGLATWSDEQIRRALTVGIDDENVPMYPIMPYPEYALLTREDVDSIIQYLRTLAPNDNVVPADYPYFDQNPPAPPIADSVVPHTTLRSDDPDFAAAERGRYLAAVACLNCHTDTLGPDVPNLEKAFAGGKRYTFIRGAPLNTSVNLTPDPSGLADWSVEDIIASLKTNTEKGTGRTLCSTHPGGTELLGGMTDGDLRDIATYLHTLPPVANGPFSCEEK